MNWIGKGFKQKVFIMALFSMLIKDYPLLGIDKNKINLHHLAGIEPPAWVEEGPVYEVFVRVFSDQGTFEQVQNKISYLKELGVQTIWLMPIYPIGKRGRKGSLGSPYSVRDYYEVNPEFGTKKDLKNLISAVHQNDMHIIIDMVANHVSKDYVEMNSRQELFVKDAHGNFTREVADWSDVTDLDYDIPFTRQYMKKVMKYWVEEFNFDGYRCDVAGMVPLDFWEEVVAELKEIKPDVYMLAEWEGSRPHVYAFHSTYDWTLYHLLKDIYKGEKPAYQAVEWVEEKRDFYPKNALPLRFIENHDEQRAAKVFGGESSKSFAAFIFSIYGVPLLYNGQEWGETVKPTLFDKVEINWNDRDENMLSFYKKLISLRNNNPALRSKKLQIIENSHPQKVLTYLKKDKGEKILVILNLSKEKLKLKMDVVADMGAKSWDNLINKELPVSVEELKSMALKPYEILLLKEDKE